MASMQPPERIGVSPNARECWDRITSDIENWPATGTDTNLAIRYCMLWATFISTIESVDRYGMIMPIKDKDGNSVGYKDRPEIERSSKLSAELTKLEEQIERQKYLARRNRGGP